MRDIKFRGKTVLKPKRWVYGSLVKITHSAKMGDVCDIFEDNEDASYDNAPVLSYTVGQFTGLRDKNGKDIYEGDIVHLDAWNPYAMQIAYIEGAFCLADKDGEFLGDIYYIHHAGVEQCTIIGNIHDNPELLNQKKEK